MRHRHKKMSEINVVPYIDVMLVLLIIFMITTPLLTQGVKVDLPKAEAELLSPKEQTPIEVKVDRQGRYYLNLFAEGKQALSAEQLSDYVVEILEKSPQRSVLVAGDRNLPYDSIIQLMVLLQKAGATTVGLTTEPPNMASDTNVPN